MEIPVLRGRLPRAHEPEHRERMHYESGRADRDAAAVPGGHEEPWLNVLEAYEPGSMPTFRWITGEESLRRHLCGQVLDVGAGTCWLTAQAALLPEVEHVFAVDLSERFLTTTGGRMLEHFRVEPRKVTWVASDFNDMPLKDGSVDCALLFAAIHHSRSPIKTLEEVGRCLRPGGAILILESLSSVLRIRRQRRRALEESDPASEIAYTREELEYLVAVAGVGPVTTIPVPSASRNLLRGAVRRLLRRLDLEHVLITPPTYLFVIEKA